MIYLYSFLFCGVICAISQYVIEKTKLTPGHINTVLVIVGCILSGFGIYDKCLEIFGSGASVPIMNFGHLIVSGVSESIDKYGLLIGTFKGVFLNSSAGISFAIFCAFINALIFKVKN